MNICSVCVELFLEANQDDLRRTHRLAIDKGYIRKLKAIESFLIPEEQNEQRKSRSKPKININRKRDVRSVRDKKERIRFATA